MYTVLANPMYTALPLKVDFLCLPQCPLYIAHIFMPL